MYLENQMFRNETYYWTRHVSIKLNQQKKTWDSTELANQINQKHSLFISQPKRPKLLSKN